MNIEGKEYPLPNAVADRLVDYELLDNGAVLWLVREDYPPKDRPPATTIYRRDSIAYLSLAPGKSPLRVSNIQLGPNTRFQQAEGTYIDANTRLGDLSLELVRPVYWLRIGNSVLEMVRPKDSKIAIEIAVSDVVYPLRPNSLVVLSDLIGSRWRFRYTLRTSGGEWVTKAEYGRFFHVLSAGYSTVQAGELIREVNIFRNYLKGRRPNWFTAKSTRRCAPEEHDRFQTITETCARLGRFPRLMARPWQVKALLQEAYEDACRDRLIRSETYFREKAAEVRQAYAGNPDLDKYRLQIKIPLFPEETNDE